MEAGPFSPTTPTCSFAYRRTPIFASAMWLSALASPKRAAQRIVAELEEAGYWRLVRCRCYDGCSDRGAGEISAAGDG